MQLINTYDNKDEAEQAEKLISGTKRLASERDGNETIYNLFGIATWGNFYKLNMFNLKELEQLLKKRATNIDYDGQRHKDIIKMLKYAETSFQLTIPNHWK